MDFNKITPNDIISRPAISDGDIPKRAVCEGCGEIHEPGDGAIEVEVVFKGLPNVDDPRQRFAMSMLMASRELKNMREANRLSMSEFAMIGAGLLAIQEVWAPIMRKWKDEDGE